MVTRTTMHCNRCNNELPRYNLTNLGIHVKGRLETFVQMEDMHPSDAYIPTLEDGDYCSFECFELDINETVDAIKKAIGDKRYGTDT